MVVIVVTVLVGFLELSSTDFMASFEVIAGHRFLFDLDSISFQF